MILILFVLASIWCDRRYVVATNGIVWLLKLLNLLSVTTVGGSMPMQILLASLIAQNLRVLRQLLSNEVFLAHVILNLLHVLFSKLIFDFW